VLLRVSCEANAEPLSSILDAVADRLEHPLRLISKDLAKAVDIARAGCQPSRLKVAEREVTHAQLARSFGLA
jgi:hypothetical protein